ncbi:unnamed protein product [Adineta steineri]|uniref:Uncharacterized protein n=2 Tax=Adineta steineri TaxID=433720 RepID=A0A819S2I5_9BILA|nr:unnamed protein product [Adineta steineri]
MLPPGAIVVPAAQYVFVPIPQVYIVPMFQNIPNPNDYIFIIHQATLLISVNVPNSNMNIYNSKQNSMINSYATHDISDDSIDNSDNEISIHHLSDSNSDVLNLDFGSDMSISSITDDDNDDGDDDYVDDDDDDDDDDEESINGAYWF